MCITDARLSDDDQNLFRDFCRILESLIHFEFHHQLETLKDCYAPFNPDADTRLIHTYSPEEKQRLQKKLVESMSQVLNAANFEKVTQTDLKEALGEESLFEIRLEVDFQDFEEVIFYRRGESKKRETLVKFFGLKKKPIEFTNYERVAIYIKFKEAAYFEARSRRSHNFSPGSTIIKLFQNVPKADLEMLFPNSEVRMKTVDKLIIGIPAAASGIAMVATKLAASILLIASIIAFWLGLKEEEVKIQQQHLVALAIGLATLGGFMFKQVNKFKNILDQQHRTLPAEVKEVVFDANYWKRILEIPPQKENLRLYGPLPKTRPRNRPRLCRRTVQTDCRSHQSGSAQRCRGGCRRDR